jgi:c-di-GMP-binding flagellar brake protein YcgR
MNISEIFAKGRKVSIKKRNNECIEIHLWIIIEKNSLIRLKRGSNEKILYDIEVNDDIEMEIVSPSGAFGFQSKIKEIVSENEIVAEIPLKIFEMKKRAFKRVEVKLAAEIMNNNSIYKGIIMDLSEGGVYIASNIEFRVGETLKIDTVISKNDRITFEGKIKRKEKFVHGKIVKKYGYGVEFIEVELEKLTEIKEYIYEVSKK